MARGGCRLLVLHGLLALFFSAPLHGCSGQADDDALAPAATAPMDEKEKRALFTAIEGFVGNGWNGSGLYPDPCGWSPIQVREDAQ